MRYFAGRDCCDYVSAAEVEVDTANTSLEFIEYSIKQVPDLFATEPALPVGLEEAKIQKQSEVENNVHCRPTVHYKNRPTNFRLFF